MSIARLFGRKADDAFRRAVWVHCKSLGLCDRDVKEIGWPPQLEEERKWRRWAPLLDRLEWLYGALVDDRSRRWLVTLFVFKIAGPEKATLPDLTAGHKLVEWIPVDEIDTPAELETSFRRRSLRCCDLSAAGYPIRLYCSGKRPSPLFDLKQYADEDNGVFANQGDVVLDGGGCYGDTALYFADRVGGDGRVVTIEFVPSNLEVMERNLSLNPNLKNRVTIVRKALWDSSGTRFSVTEDGPATRVSLIDPESNANADLIVEGTSIDDIVASGEVDRIDFIKMDIEGAEPFALAGAEKTIRDFRPRLALCVYHHPKDFVRLAEFLDGLNLGYRFSLRHFTNHAWETVLFAWCE